MITIQFTKANLISAIRQKSHLEVQDIADPEARDNARAGLEKMPEIERCLKSGVTQASRRCWRFLDDAYAPTLSYGDSVNSTLTFNFSMSERRALNKTEPLAAAIHDLIIEYAMSKFYVSVNQGALSQAHSLAAVAAAEEIDELLYNKKPPRV